MTASTDSRRSLILLTAATIAVMAWSGWKPHDLGTWVLEVVPVWIVLPLLWFTRERFALTPLLYLLIFVHAVVLMVGGHYTYARVPAGFWVQEWFDLSRNHYDRLGHLMQGFVPAIAAREILLRRTPLRVGGWLFTLVTAVCLAISALYELIEWGAAIALGSGAEEFLAMQGDPWDTQKDMAMAWLGAMLAQWSLGRTHDRQLARLRVGDA